MNMNLTLGIQLVGVTILVLCACVSSAMQPRSDQYVDLLGKLKSAQRVRQNNAIEDPTEEFKSRVMGPSANKRFQDFYKRQGAWSYDYGLGGGRFGKRNYGDYGIGGGRFGRSVDHVDTSDVTDSDMTL